MRKGGTAKTLRWIIICLIALSGFVFVKLISVKKNYTDLHRRVTQLEYEFERSYGD